MIQSNWVRSPSCKPQIHSYAGVMRFMPCQRAFSVLPGTAVGGLRRGCSASQTRLCFSHPVRPGRREISPCTAFFYWQNNHQGAPLCTSAAVEAPGAEKYWMCSTLDHIGKQYKFIWAATVLLIYSFSKHGENTVWSVHMTSLVLNSPWDCVCVCYLWGRWGQIVSFIQPNG